MNDGPTNDIRAEVQKEGDAAIGADTEGDGEPESAAFAG